MPLRALMDRVRAPWSAASSLSILLVALLLLLLLPGFGRAADVLLVLVSNLLLTVLLLAGVLSLTSHPTARLLCWALVLIALAIRWLHGTGWFPALLNLSLLSTLFGLMAIAWVVLLQVSRAGPVSAHHVRGAMALYLLLAAIFAYAYTYLELIRPGAFKLPTGWSPQSQYRPETFYYFSVVTLTTLGYGDITAVDGGARDLVMLEALIGQLYPAIILARLVTLELYARQSSAAATPPRAEGQQEARGEALPESGEQAGRNEE